MKSLKALEGWFVSTLLVRSILFMPEVSSLYLLVNDWPFSPVSFVFFFWLWFIFSAWQLQILFNYAKTGYWVVCWFSWISLFLPVLARADHKIVLRIKTKQFYDHIMQKLVKTCKNTRPKKQKKSTNNRMLSFGSIEENVELSHIDLAVMFYIT